MYRVDCSLALARASKPLSRFALVFDDQFLFPKGLRDWTASAGVLTMDKLKLTVLLSTIGLQGALWGFRPSRVDREGLLLLRGHQLLQGSQCQQRHPYQG